MESQRKAFVCTQGVNHSTLNARMNIRWVIRKFQSNTWCMPRSFQYKNLMASKHPCVTLLKGDVNTRYSVLIFLRTNYLKCIWSSEFRINQTPIFIYIQLTLCVSGGRSNPVYKQWKLKERLASNSSFKTPEKHQNLRFDTVGTRQKSCPNLSHSH
jgi:hypothetical protein